MLNGSGGYIKINGGDIEIGTSGTASFKASMKELAGGGNSSNAPPRLVAPGGLLVLPEKFSGRLDVYDLFVRNQFSDVSYYAKLKDGRYVAGALDEHGRSRQIYATESQNMELLVGSSQPEWDLIFDYEEE